ncbi:reverse transcriptase domain-containing protein [Tanacetum coccineum]
MNRIYESKSNMTHPTNQKLYDTLYESICLDHDALNAQHAESPFHKWSHDNQDSPNNCGGGGTRRNIERMPANLLLDHQGETNLSNTPWFDLLLKLDIDQNENHILGPSTIAIVKKLKAIIQKDELTIANLEGCQTRKAKATNSDEGDVSKPKSYLVDLSMEDNYTTSITKHYAARYYKEVRRFDDKEYEFNYADLPRLSVNGVEDIRTVIKNMVEEIQLGVESYQRTLNLTKPTIFFERIDQRIPFTMTATQKGVIYLNQYNIKSLKKLSEVKKFCDGTLVKIQENLIDMVSNNKLGSDSEKDVVNLLKQALSSLPILKVNCVKDRSLIAARALQIALKLPIWSVGQPSSDHVLIGELLGFSKFIPSYSTAFNNEISRGVNYGSGCAGIRKKSGSHLTLYSLGARKIVVFGLANIGCSPAQIDRFGTDGRPCVQKINDAVELFNNRLMPLVDELNNNKTDARFTFINLASILTPLGDVPLPSAPCCQVRKDWQCIPNSVPCPIRSMCIFFDGSHPTEVSNIIIATRSYTAVSITDAYPYDISQLLGFDGFIKSYATATDKDISKGVNYASGGCGIREETGSHNTLYNLGGRKIALFGLSQIGCTPLLVNKLGSAGKPCVASANDAVNLFNARFKPLVDELNKEKSDARFTFINTTGILYPQGVVSLRTPACCQLTGVWSCTPNSNPCPIRSVSVYFDALHPTELSNIAIATRAYKTFLPTVALPIRIHHLTQV